MRDNDLQNLSRTDICLWLDFYGELLTNHTRDVLELHFSEDMSLSEIAENLGITRQAVHDRIRQGTGSLMGFEDKLGLAARFKTQKVFLAEALQALDNGEMTIVREKLQQLNANL
ncbi:MAG TPA: hypothetical protein DCM45_01065 [Clostridiales bacterium]|nr:hypothetical protein [Clostridiales bacterium]